MSAPTSQIEAVTAVRQDVSDLTAGKPHLLFFCSDASCLRYLRARDMDVTQAVKLLRETLQWRDRENMHATAYRDLGTVAATGKIMRAACTDKQGRPVLILRPKHENEFKDQQANLRHFAYQMEMTTRYADRHSPDGKITTLLDYTGFAMKNNPPMKTSMATLHMIQSYYPERLHEALLWHPPALFQAVWKALSPFVEVKTRHKIKFLMQRDPTSPAQLAERLDVSVLDASCGGTRADVFDYAATAALMAKEEEQYREELTHFAEVGCAWQPGSGVGSGGAATAVANGMPTLERAAA